MSWLDTLEEIRKRDYAKATAKEREHAAREVINMSSYAVSLGSMLPLPFSDALIVVPVQVTMVMTLGHIFDRRANKKEATQLLLDLTAATGASYLARQGLKMLLPVIGGVLMLPATFAANWAMGRLAMEYFKNPDLPRDTWRGIYETAKHEGGSLFSKEKFDSFRKRHEQDMTAAGEATAPSAKKPRRKAPAKRKARAPRQV